MANANGSIVVNASHPWDNKILEELSRKLNFDLIFMDREEDPEPVPPRRWRRRCSGKTSRGSHGPSH